MVLDFSSEKALDVNKKKLMLTTSLTSPFEVASGFHALSDPLRVRVLELLQQREYCVCELCEQLHVSQSKLSFHLKALREASLVRARQESRWVYYSVNLNQFGMLEQYLSDYRRRRASL